MNKYRVQENFAVVILQAVHGACTSFTKHKEACVANFKRLLKKEVGSDGGGERPVVCEFMLKPALMGG